MLRTKQRAGAVALVAAALALALAGSAGAATHRVSGRQIPVDLNAGTYRMTGALVGQWSTTSFQVTATTPYLQGEGTETFSGCLDRGRDGSCRRDPTGTISFTFLYWGKFASADPASMIWGACWHPVVSGTGAFAGAEGVLTFVDTPTPRGVRTRDIGNIRLAGAGSAERSSHAKAATARPTCGAG